MGLEEKRGRWAGFLGGKGILGKFPTNLSSWGGKKDFTPNPFGGSWGFFPPPIPVLTFGIFHSRSPTIFPTQAKNFFFFYPPVVLQPPSKRKKKIALAEF